MAAEKRENRPEAEYKNKSAKGRSRLYYWEKTKVWEKQKMICNTDIRGHWALSHRVEETSGKARHAGSGQR